MKNFINRALVAKKKLKLFFALFAMLALNAATAWAENAPVNTVLWGENFEHFGTNTPSNAKTGTGTTIYDGASITYTQSSTSTKGYKEKLAGGTAPELLLSKSNQTWTISGIKTGGATKMSLTFLSNKTAFSVSVSSANLTVSGSGKSWTITLKDGQTVPETFDLTIKNTASKDNARIDDVVLKVTVAGTTSATPVDPEVSFSNSTYTVGQTLDLSTLWTSNSDGAVTYSIVEASTTGASINGKSFTASAAGTCTVKASQAATSAYNAIETTATITVTATTPEEPGGDGEETWILVTDASTLKADEEVIIAASGDNKYALSTTQKSSNRAGTAITKNGNTLVEPSADVQILTLKAGSTSGTFAFYTGTSGYLYAASSSSNQLKTKTTLDVHGSWTISITEGVASIAAKGSSNRNVMQYNYNNGDPLFNCYASASQTALAIYKKVTSSGSGSTEPVATLTDEQFNWSAKTATALKGADNNKFPTLTNDLGLTVTYDSSNEDVATIASNGKITLRDHGTTTISAAFAGGEVNETTYKAKTVTYTLTVKQLVSCTDIYNLTDDATFVLKEFVVTYVNGQYTYIKDATGYGLIFNNTGDYGLKAGDQVASGKLEGKKDTYNGLVEIIPTTTAADLNATPGTAPEPDVMTNTPTNADINKYVKFENVLFKYTNLNDTHKTNSGKLEGQTEYNIAFYNKFTSNVTFDTSKKYDVLGVVSIKDDAIEVYFISAEEVAEPTLNVKITNADFGKIAINGKAERTLTLNGSLLTKPISLAIEGEGAEHFKLSSYSVDPTDDGNITNAKITITYKPTAEGTHTATLKITSDDVDEQTIELKGQAAQEYTVHFHVNGAEDETLKKTVLSGNTLEDLPEATSCDLLNYPTFAGWASDEIDGTTDVKPTMLDKSTPITRDCDYYAVFAKGTTSSGTVNTSYELVLLPSHFTTSYDERSFKATANEVDGEGTLEISLTSAGVMKSTDASKGNPIQFRKKSSSNPGVLYNTTDLGQINSISYAEGTNNIASTIIGASQQPTEQEDGKGFFMITNGTSVSYIPSITINFTKTSVSEIITYEYITSCAAVVQTYEITYNFDGGEGVCTTAIVEEGAEYTLCATAPTKAGHTFLHWKDQNDTVYAVGATIDSVAENLTLTAQWQVNSYPVTWMSLGDEVLVDSTNYNTQPTKPTTALSYTCGIGSKEFVGWTTQEIDGIGIPANLYTDEFPVVTEAITYYAVFASKIEGGSMSKAVSLTNGETVYLATESGIGVTGAVADEKDATVSSEQSDWMPFTVVTNGLQYQFKTGDNYITAAAKSFKITATPSDFAFANSYIVYNVLDGSDKGDYVLLYNSNNGNFYRFYKNSNIGKENYETFYVYKNPTHTDYTTSCPVLELTEGENTLTNEVTVDVKVNRSFEKDKLYTISLPFALDAAQVNDIFGDGTTLYQFAQLAKEDGELVLYFSKPSAIAAATPYLIEPAQKVDAGFIVEDAIISTTPNNISFTVGATTITMKPILSAADGAKTNGRTEYWLAADRYLYNNENTLLSLRALFNISTVSGMPPRCRVVLGENVETSIDNITSGENTTIKVIENGQLIIIRNGEKFNAQGVRF